MRVRACVVFAGNHLYPITSLVAFVCVYSVVHVIPANSRSVVAAALLDPSRARRRRDAAPTDDALEFEFHDALVIRASIDRPVVRRVSFRFVIFEKSRPTGDRCRRFVDARTAVVAATAMERRETRTDWRSRRRRGGYGWREEGRDG